VDQELKNANLGEELDKASKLKGFRTKEAAGISRILPILSEARSSLAPLRQEIIGEFKQVFSADIMESPTGTSSNPCGTNSEKVWLVFSR